MTNIPKIYTHVNFIKTTHTTFLRKEKAESILAVMKSDFIRALLLLLELLHPLPLHVRHRRAASLLLFPHRFEHFAI